MSRYRVNSSPTAIADLATIWTGLKDRSAVSAASDTADIELADDPKGAGDHLSEGLWLLKVAPLRLYFTIDEDDLLVTITNVRFDLPPQ
ncbi:MAG: type II toxin-antitoxin system RelE/ParE family toxin [Planctomycetota bacterium]